MVPSLAAREKDLSAISMRAISTREIPKDTASFFQIENERKNIKVYNNLFYFYLVCSNIVIFTRSSVLFVFILSAGISSYLQDILFYIFFLTSRISSRISSYLQVFCFISLSWLLEYHHSRKLFCSICFYLVCWNIVKLQGFCFIFLS